MKTAKELAEEIYMELSDLSQSLINIDLLVHCVQIGMDNALQQCTACFGCGRLKGRGIYVRGIVINCPKCNGTGRAPNEPMAGPGEQAGFGREDGCDNSGEKNADHK
jgi:hypothetical protein